MMRVSVIPTGRMEWEALDHALRTLFPSHHFECLPPRAELASNADLEFPIPSFTSCDANRLLGRENNADKLLGRAAAEALGDSHGRAAADLVVVLDDLELANQEQPQAVIRVVREAVNRNLDGLRIGTRARTQRALRERVSFHLAAPMIESWLFAGPRGHLSAGVPSDRPPRLRDVDPEQFETDDEGYAAATLDTCTCWQALPDRRASQRKRRGKLRPAWAGQHDRTRHPKGYLQWLCFEPSAKSCTTYDESANGAHALKVLDWKRVLARHHMPYLRSLVADIADALGEPPSVDFDEEHQAPLTSRRTTAQDAVLRNL